MRSSSSMYRSCASCPGGRSPALLCVQSPAPAAPLSAGIPVPVPPVLTAHPPPPKAVSLLQKSIISPRLSQFSDENTMGRPDPRLHNDFHRPGIPRLGRFQNILIPVFVVCQRFAFLTMQQCKAQCLQDILWQLHLRPSWTLTPFSSQEQRPPDRPRSQTAPPLPPGHADRFQILPCDIVDVKTQMRRLNGFHRCIEQREIHCHKSVFFPRKVSAKL